MGSGKLGEDYSRDFLREFLGAFALYIDDPQHEMNGFKFPAILMWFCKKNLKNPD